MRSRLLAFLVVPLVWHASFSQTKPALPAAIPHFVDISQSAGLTVSHISSADKKYIIESVSGGVGFIDCDNDGKLNIIMVNGSSVDRYRNGGDPMITLYHQEPNLKFKDITMEAGLTRKGWGMGVAVADFDNDGWDDIYVTGYGGSVLYRNKGNCRFEDLTAKAGVNVDGFPTGAAWGDFDRDGNVDLFVPRYVHVDINHLPEFGSNDRYCAFMGIRVQCGPAGLPGETDFLFRNRGNGTFEDVSKKAGVDNLDLQFGMQGIWADYDNDGWPDLYVANDAGSNYLYRNKHDGTFENVSLSSGTAVSGDGHEQGSMGVDFGDIDHDGKLDLFVTNFTQQPDALYWNRGAQGFDDISISSGVGPPTDPYVGWGTGLVDFVNDGWLDVFEANGHVYPQMDQVRMGVPYRQPLFLFRNNRDRTFKDITHLSGLDKLPRQSRRGVAFGDVNNDGRVDVLMLNVGEPPTLLLNCSETPDHAVLFKLVGTKSNRSAIGARATVTAGDLVQIGEVRSGGSYLSQNDLRLHFGLAGNSTMSTVEIAWPSGQKDTLHNLAADFIYTIAEGSGIRSKQAFAATDCPKENPSH